MMMMLLDGPRCAGCSRPNSMMSGDGSKVGVHPKIYIWAIMGCSPGASRLEGSPSSNLYIYIYI